MDGTRTSDLDTLMMVIHNPDESVAHKRQATRAMRRIKAQMGDPKIKHLRERLVRANQAEDSEGSAKISDELTEYQLRHYPAQ
jgi:hypothetical protein